MDGESEPDCWPQPTNIIVVAKRAKNVDLNMRLGFILGKHCSGDVQLSTCNTKRFFERAVEVSHTKLRIDASSFQ